MAKANQKYATGHYVKIGTKEVDTTRQDRAAKSFENRREHNHCPQGKTGYIPHGSEQTDLSILKR